MVAGQPPRVFISRRLRYVVGRGRYRSQCV